MENTANLTGNDSSGLQVAQNFGSILLLGGSLGSAKAQEASNSAPISSLAGSTSRLSHASFFIDNISEYDAFKVQQRTARCRQNGTGEWLLKLPLVQSWLNGSEDSHIWCYAKVGFGKTILTSLLVEATQDKASGFQGFVGYYYVFSTGAITPRAVDVIQSLIKKQFVHLERKVGLVPSAIRAMIYDLYGSKHNLTDVEDAMNVFIALSKKLGAQFYIIDGVDLLSPKDAKDLFNGLRAAFSNASGLRLFLFSRKEIDRNIDLTNLIPGLLALELLENDNCKDIEMLIKTKMDAKMAMARPLSSNDELMEYVRQELARKAHGMMLWIDLKIEELWEDCETDTDILKYMDSIPEKLEDVYLRCLQRIQNRKREAVASRVFRWLACGSRLLHIEELQEAVAFTENDKRWTEDNIRSAKVLIDSCANLVALSSEDHLVRFIHPSVQQYLQDTTQLSEFRIDVARHRLRCAADSMNYLDFEDFALTVAAPLERMSTNIPSDFGSRLALEVSPSVGDLSSRITKFVGRRKSNVTSQRPLGIERSQRNPKESAKFKFLPYASKCWALDCQDISRESPLWHRAQKLARTPNSSWNFHPWGSQARSYEEYLYAVFTWSVVNGHIALILGLQEELPSRKMREFVRREFPSTLVPEALANSGMSAAHAALLVGHAEIFEELVKHAHNEKDARGNTLMHYAALKGDLRLADLLGVKTINLGRSKPTETPIYLAAMQGHTEMVLYLCHRSGSTTNDGERNCWLRALSAAITSGRDETAATLIERLERGNPYSSIFIQDYNQKSLQSWMVKHRMIQSITQILKPSREPQMISIISADQDPPAFGLHLQDVFFNSTFKEILTAREDPRKIKRTIVQELKSDLAAKVFWLAVLTEDLAFIENLLQIRPIVDIRTIRSIGFALAAFEGSTDVLRLMCRVESSLMGNTWLESQLRASLSLAVWKQNPVAISALSDCGANLDQLQCMGEVYFISELFREPPVEGLTPLHLSVIRNSMELTLALLGCGATVDIQDPKSVTPLHLAAYYTRLQAVLALLKFGASINMKDANGNTPLHVFAGCNAAFYESYESEIDKAEPRGSPEQRGETQRLLLEAATATVPPILNSENEGGEKAIHFASWRGDKEMVKGLIGAGVDLNSPNATGQTALHLAMLVSHIDIVVFLVENGASVHSRDWRGGTPHHYLGWRDRNALSILKLLVKHQADINARDQDGYTLFYKVLEGIPKGATAALLPPLQCVSFLQTMMDLGADTNLRPPGKPDARELLDGLLDLPEGARRSIREMLPH